MSASSHPAAAPPRPADAPAQDVDAAPDAPLPLDLFDFALPPERIAQAPAEPRDSSRMMVLAGAAAPVHAQFLDLPQWLAPGDLLVINRTCVIPARLHVRRASGGAVELLFFAPDGEHETAHTWRALARPAAKLRPSDVLRTAAGAELRVLGRDGAAVVLQATGPLMAVLEREGEVPLPPYLAREDGPSSQDAQSYQTLFARERGAVAAPTASLHFTQRAMDALRARGVAVAEVVLHVGPGTFLPVRPELAFDVRAHRMHAEAYHVPPATQAQVQATRAAGRRVVAVGTTSLRALETWAHTQRATGHSELFVVPGYRFACVDALLTNFHLPRSTLLMLVSAMAGRERILSAYAEATEHGYRFFSYGDAMLLLPAGAPERLPSAG